VPIQLLVFSAMVCGPLSGWLAMRRERPALLWLLLGAAAGPFAVGIIYLAPLGRCPRCRSSTQGWDETCARCGADLRPGELGRADAPTTDADAGATGAVDAAAPGAVGRSVTIVPETRPAETPVPQPTGVRVYSSSIQAIAGSGSRPFDREPDASPRPAATPTATPVQNAPPVAPEGVGVDGAPVSARVAPGQNVTDQNALAALLPVLDRPGTAGLRPGLTMVARVGSLLDEGISDLRVVASGVFLAGSLPLLIGNRYLIGIDGDLVVLVNPYVESARAIATRRSRRGLTVSDVGMTTTLASANGDFSITFRAVTVVPGFDLHRDLPIGDAPPPGDSGAPDRADASDPSDGAPDPADGAAEPTDATAEPADGAPDPAGGAAEPTDATAEPADGARDPGEGDPDPADGTAEPTEGTLDPAETTADRTGGATDPAVDAR
jgi:hypothetical protein